MIVELVDLSVARGGTLVLKDVNATFEGPGLIQVIGPNGAGKTTLFLTILGILKPVKGSVRVNGVIVNGSPNRIREHISYIPQEFHVPREAPISIWEFVEDYAKAYKGVRGFRTPLEIKDKVASALKSAGLSEDMWSKRLSELSGGQLQRALIARALSTDSDIIVMDEPLSNIDPEGRRVLADIIGGLSHSKLVIASSHDPILLLPYTSKIMVLGYGVYRYGDPEEILTQEVLSNIYRGCIIVLEKHPHISDWH